MNYTSIKIEGGILSPDFLENIAEAEGQKPVDFGLPARRSLVDEISSLWSDVRSYWDAFKNRRRRYEEAAQSGQPAGSESATTLTREQWIIPLLEALGYQLVYQRQGVQIESRNYVISHRTGKTEEDLPVHIVAYDQKLDARPADGRSPLSPHAMLQDYLNRSEHLWGLVTNGFTLRLLRNSVYFTRPSYIEFDLEQILEANRLDEFFLFYRLVHRTRLPKNAAEGAVCLLEKYHQFTLEQGNRIRDGLRDAVASAIVILANGFLNNGFVDAEKSNQELRQKLQQGELSAQEFYQQLLYLIYRLLFLLVAEERGLMNPAAATPWAEAEGAAAGEMPQAYYFSLRRLRELADEPLSAPERFCDLYLNLRVLFHCLRHEEFAAQIGLPPLNGELFSEAHMRDLETAYLNNKDLLQAMHKLSWFMPRDQQVLTRVNYRHLDVEELGSVYESLLDLQPVVEENAGRLRFHFETGTERRSTGSYYTPPALVQELIKSALEPLIARCLQYPTAAEKERALLSLKICDPACGSGHFLLAAARRLGNALAQVRTGEEAPPPDTVRHAVREVISHCLYGVDKNPLAVDLCKVALWMESQTNDKPLTFLDHRIRCGDSLVGVFDLAVLNEGIPDEAYTPLEGDERDIATSCRSQNRQERRGQRTLDFAGTTEIASLLQKRQELLSLPDDTVAQVAHKRQIWEQIQQQDEQMRRDRLACDLWTAAFFAPLTTEAREGCYIPTTADVRRCLQNFSSLDARLVGFVQALARRLHFFHWPLEFPEVFAQGGFDCVLSNPPWERIKLQEKEFFASRDPEIANASNTAARRQLIEKLAQKNPPLYQEFLQAKHDADATSLFLHQSSRYPFTGKGDINTYAVFAELCRNLLGPQGRAGIITPTGIATDATTQEFFQHLTQQQLLGSLYEFENREGLFPEVHRRFRFCLLTIQGQKTTEPARFAFFLTHPRQLSEQAGRVFTLSAADFAWLNPNTGTCPVFRTRADADLTRYIYRRVPILINEQTGANPWGIRFLAMFHMSNDSHLFSTSSGEGLVPLYEAKMIWHYDHRYGSFEGFSKRPEGAHLPKTTKSCYENASFSPKAWYWVEGKKAIERVLAISNIKKIPKWLIVYRFSTSPTNERTMVLTVIPFAGTGNVLPCIFIRLNYLFQCFFIANMNTLVYDYILRNKMGRQGLDQFLVKQIPTLPPNLFNNKDLLFIIPRVWELVYTAWDIKAFADDVWREADEALRQALRAQGEANRAETGGHRFEPPAGAPIAPDGCPLPPCKWNEARRARLQAELDAYYARLYGLTRKQLRYILDPHGLSAWELKNILDPQEDPTCDGPHLLPAHPAEDFPSETFRVLKEKEEQKYGEFRTRRLILAAWAEQEALFPPA